MSGELTEHSTLNLPIARKNMEMISVTDSTIIEIS